MTSTVLSPLCAGCGKAGATLQCPKCRELGLPQTLFCEQSCFKKSWKTHKQVHDQPAPCTLSSMSREDAMMFQFMGNLRPGMLSARRTVPKHIQKPDYADHPMGISACEEQDPTRMQQRSARVELYRADGKAIEALRKVCRLAREVLDIAGRAVKAGVATDELDRVVHEAAIERNCYPSPLNYRTFPKSVCTSINEVICHGIPDSHELEDGDIINIDVTLYHDGYHGDVNETFYVGKVDTASQRLVNGSYDCLMAAIAAVKPGVLYRKLGDIIESVARERKLSVVRTYCGHGIHKLFHTSPTIPHYAKNKAVGVMQVGHVFTIEPMINLGHWSDVLWPDQWTSSTQDGSRSAQFEETLLVTETGCEVLTARPAVYSTDGSGHCEEASPQQGATYANIVPRFKWQEQQWDGGKG